MTSITPLGDQAALVYFTNEAEALAFANGVQQNPPDWLIDLVQAYVSVAVYFDLQKIRFADVAQYLQEHVTPTTTAGDHNRTHVIPCCYEMQSDIGRVQNHTGLSEDDIIKWHLQTEYTVYAIGFSPGFPYLGYLPEALCGVPRLESPRVHVDEGTVALTGRQTGIYTLPRPGGWNLIGKTPLQLVDVEDEYFPIRTGDKVRFQRIDETAFRRLQGQRLNG